jgi:hypothetical protein
MWKRLHIKYPLFLSDLMKLKIVPQIFEKNSNINFRQNSSIGNRFIPYGKSDTQMDMTQLIIVFRNFTNAPMHLLIIFSAIQPVKITVSDILLLRNVY